jgi:hypothetical protein
MLGDEHELLSSSFYGFLYLHGTSFLFRPKILLGTQFVNTFSYIKMWRVATNMLNTQVAGSRQGVVFQVGG